MLRHNGGVILHSHASSAHVRPMAPAIPTSASGAARQTDADRATANAKPVLQGTVAASRVQLAAKLAETADQSQPKSSNAKANTKSADSPTELSEPEERAEQKLKQTDAKVRAHERAHSAAGGSHAGSASYEYAAGPSGRRYAVSGEVSIDTSTVRDNPEATVRKMDIVISAALAPADPSSQDLAVARQAQSTRAQAQTAATKQREAEDAKNKPSEMDATTASQNAENQEKEPLASARLEANAAYSGYGGGGPVADTGAVATEIFSALFA